MGLMKIARSKSLFMIFLLLPLFSSIAAKDNKVDRFALVARLYRDFGGEQAPSLVDQKMSVLERYFTPGLAALLDEEGKRRVRYPGELGLLDFEPLSGSQDPDMHDMNFRPVGREEVLALFRTSTGQRVTIRYHLSSVCDEWRIDDITYTRPRCSLRELLGQKFVPLAAAFHEPFLEPSPIKTLPRHALPPSNGDLAKADEALNLEYRKLSTALGTDARERLRNAQRVWISERDAFAAAHPSRREESLLHATRQRTRELAAILAGPVLPAR